MKKGEEMKAFRVFNRSETSLKNDPSDTNWNDLISCEVKEEFTNEKELNTSDADFVNDKEKGVHELQSDQTSDLKVKVLIDELPPCENFETKPVKIPLKNILNHTKYAVKNFRCVHCAASYFHKGDLKRHVGFKHLNIRPFHCYYCSYSTGRKCSLERHIMWHHMQVKLFQCKLCPYKGATKYRLRRHALIHNKSKRPEDNYNCSYCNFRTKYKESIQKHLNRKHAVLFKKKCVKIEGPLKTWPKIIRKKLHKCTQCDFRTKTPTRLEDHMFAVHSNTKPYKCELCPFTTSYRESVKRHHIVNHSKKIRCTICSLTFGSKLLLNNHITYEHIIAPVFSLEEDLCFCSYCFESFHCKENLQRHIKIRHRKKF